jgi:hypothetical protein
VALDAVLGARRLERSCAPSTGAQDPRELAECDLRFFHGLRLPILLHCVDGQDRSARSAENWTTVPTATSRLLEKDIPLPVEAC